MGTDFTGIVLAGGRSTRMGRDKASLPRGDATLLDHMIDVLRRAGASQVRVSGERPGHGGIPDAWPGRGPVGGIASVLPHCGDGPAIVVPVDLPLLAGGTIAALLQALAAHPAAFHAGHPLPAALRIDTRLRDSVARLMAGGGEGPPVRGLLAKLGAVELPAPPGRDLQPCNTPADWAAIAR